MLIPIYELVDKFNSRITGIVHIGAHECEEMGDYKLVGIPPERTIWFEAQANLVNKYKQIYPTAQIYQAALSDIDDQVRQLIITNNIMSSSLLELKEHLVEHPHVQEIRRDTVVTNTFKTFVKKNHLDLTGYNFINLDIQGLELQVIKGMEELLDQFEYIYMEVNTKELYAGCALLPEIDEYLAGRGFKRVDIRMTPYGWGDAMYIRNRVGKLTIDLCGGLGNQLFQIFFILGLAIKYGMTIVLPNKYKLDNKRHTYYQIFPDLELTDAKLENAIYINEANFPQKIDSSKNYIFQGYFQSHKYLENIVPLDYIKLPVEDKKNINRVVDELRSHNRPLISVHVRRGDYLLVQHFHNILGPEYYKNAMEFFGHIKNPLFVVFSEDKEWCDANLGFLDFVFIKEKDYLELIIMSKCDHHIVANSSFSWWGAFLNQQQDKIVVYPSKWYEMGVDITNLTPPSWKSCKIDSI
jgi:FkbM family methyltransferase